MLSALTNCDRCGQEADIEIQAWMMDVPRDCLSLLCPACQRAVAEPKSYRTVPKGRIDWSKVNNLRDLGEA